MFLRRGIAAGLTAGLIMAGCSGQPSPERDPATDYELLTGNQHTAYLYQGGYVDLPPETDDAITEQLVEEIPAAHKRKGNFEQGVKAIGNTAQRVIVRTSVYAGKDLQNAYACDKFEVADTEWEGRRYVAILAIGDSDTDAFAVWPKDSNELRLCFADGKHADDGFVMAAPEVAR